jgi:hypothetical protein
MAHKNNYSAVSIAHGCTFSAAGCASPVTATQEVMVAFSLPVFAALVIRFWQFLVE